MAIGNIACPHNDAYIGRVSSHADLTAPSTAGQATASGYVCASSTCQEKAMAAVREFAGTAVFVPFSKR